MLPAVLFAGSVGAQSMVPDTPRPTVAEDLASHAGVDSQAGTVDSGLSAWVNSLTRGSGRTEVLTKAAADAAPVPMVMSPAGNEERRELIGSRETEAFAGLTRAVVTDGSEHKALIAAGGGAPAGRQGVIADDDLATELTAAVNALHATVTETIAEAVDARVGRDGRVSFALAGIGGFHLASEAGQVTLGYGDATVTFGQLGDAPASARALQPGPAERPAASGAAAFNPAREVVALLKDAVEYPLFWVIVFFLVVGKIALVVASRRSARRSRPKASVRPPAPKQRVRMKVRLTSRSRNKLAGDSRSHSSASPTPQET